MSLELEVIDIEDDVVPLSPPPLKRAKLVSETDQVPTTVPVTAKQQLSNDANGHSERPPVTVSIENVVQACHGNVTKTELEKVCEKM